MAESLFATLFPSDCRLCSAPLTNISRLPVCEECLAAIRPIDGAVCTVCGERILTPYAVQGSVRCGLCQRVDLPFEKAAAYGSYEAELRGLVHLLKYQQVRPVANVLGRMLAEVISSMEPSFGSAEVLVVPVPLHRAKWRQRGFNQTDLITQAALKSLPHRERFVLQPSLLKRTRATRSQIGLTRHQRRENMRGAFSVTKAEQIAGREVLLVDDVMTTGTTISECARILHRAGAIKIWAVTVARTLKIGSGNMRITKNESTLAVAG